jgi:hypothetical protein
MIGLSKRHVADREYKSEPQYERCHCPVWYQTNRDGKQTRWSSEDRGWEAAERKARKLDQAEATGARCAPAQEQRRFRFSRCKQQPRHDVDSFLFRRP